MAFAWADTFVAASAVTGMNNGDHTAIDEWPITSDACFIQLGSLGTGTVTFSFDMSAGPGDKKGFWVWFQSHVDNANGFSITETRLTDGTTTLWTDSSPGITVTETTFAASKLRVFRIPDSAMSTDPTISGLVLEFDVANLNAGNNRFRFSGMRMSKSPFTAAQETDPPSSLSGADFSCYKASDLAVLGAVDTEAVVVRPDGSGNGRHLIRKTGTTSLYEDDTIDYVSYPSGGGSVFFGAWGSRVTGNHIWHAHIFPEDTGTTQGVFSYSGAFAGAVNPPTDPNDKNILGIDDEGSGDKLLLMSGIGDVAAHRYGATTVTFDAWVRVTEWIQDSGNEKLWINDDASPDVDAASGSNNMFSVTVGNRESEDRPFQGRDAELWWIDGSGFTEANIDAARDEWVNGVGGAEDFSGGSTASVSVTPDGLGSTSRSGGNTASVDVSTSSVGAKAAAEGTTAGVLATPSGAGSKSVSAGSTAPVTVDPSGEGSKSTLGSSTAGVTVTASGGGSSSESEPSGGSTANVQVTVEGEGKKVSSGGSTASVIATTTTDGTKAGRSGSTANITVTASGDGTADQPEVSGGSTAQVSVTAESGWSKTTSGGSTSNVTVDAFGGGILLVRLRLEGRNVSGRGAEGMPSGIGLEGTRL